MRAPGDATVRLRGSTRRFALVAAGTGLGFVVLALLIRAGATAVLTPDRNLADALHRFALGHAGQVTAWKVVTTVLGPDVWRVAAVPAAIALWLRRRRADAVLVAVAVLGTGVWSSLGKILVDRDRPVFAHPVATAGGQSYPSGHALTSLVACAAILVLCTPSARRRLAVPAALVVVAVGASRLVLGVHYLSDVIGGWLLGTAWLAVVVLVVRRVARRH